MADDELVSNRMMDAIDAICDVQELLRKAAKRCSGWSSSFSNDLDRVLELSNEWIGELESLIGDAERYDDAHAPEE